MICTTSWPGDPAEEGTRTVCHRAFPLRLIRAVVVCLSLFCQYVSVCDSVHMRCEFVFNFSSFLGFRNPEKSAYRIGVWWVWKQKSLREMRWGERFSWSTEGERMKKKRIINNKRLAGSWNRELEVKVRVQWYYFVMHEKWKEEASQLSLIQTLTTWFLRK